jgi:hypothetical protein
MAPVGGTPLCIASECDFECVAPAERCSDVCANTMTSAAHCGGCGEACDPVTGGTVRCSDGECLVTCDTGLILCDGFCVDPQEDSSHCGRCDRVCNGINQICIAGRCQNAG